jgi:hypothetical protein
VVVVREGGEGVIGGGQKPSYILYEEANQHLY